MIQKNIFILPGFRTIFLIIVISVVTQSINAANSGDIGAKAGLAVQKLNQAMKDGKDVSGIVPMMQRVKKLGDEKKTEEVNALLDEILIEFDLLYESSATNNDLVAKNKRKFHTPRLVKISGYEKSVMEPFISRDGKYMFFNNYDKETPKTGKDIYYAERVDDTNFKFMGEVKGINSADVDGVPSMDKNSNFYYVSLGDYGKKNGFTTIYSGKFNDGVVTDIHSHPELSLNAPGWVNMDIEVNAEGNTLYSTQTYFSKGPPPQKSYFFQAHRKGDKFEIDSRSDEIFKLINTDDLEYGISISTDELEILFTRFKFDSKEFVSYLASRPSKDAAFSAPTRIEAITGFSEAPAFTNNGRQAYYHKKKGKHFALYLLNRELD